MATLETKGNQLLIDGKPVLAGWESFSGWYWFGIEKAEERKAGSETGGSIVLGLEVDDVIWFGYIQGFDNEWGYFSEAEIRSLGPCRAWKIKACDLPCAGRRGR